MLPGKEPLGLTAISCPSTSLCLVSDEQGQLWSSPDPAAQTWTATTAVEGSNEAILTVTCPTTTSCLATDAKGYVLTSERPTAGTWRRTPPPSGEEPAGSVVCTITRVCTIANGAEVSTDPFAAAPKWTPGGAAASHLTWQGIHSDAGGMEGVSCPSMTLCATVTNETLSYSTNPASPTATWKDVPVKSLPGYTAGDALSHVACAASTLCAVDVSNELNASGIDRITLIELSNPGPPQLQEEPVHPTHTSGLACPSPKLCVVIDQFGGVYVGTR